MFKLVVGDVIGGLVTMALFKMHMPFAWLLAIGLATLVLYHWLSRERTPCA